MKNPGYDREVVSQLEKVSGKPACTDMTGVMEAFSALGIKRLVMAAPFEDWVNELIKKYLAASGFDIVHMKGLPLVAGSERRALPVSVEYTFTRRVFREYDGQVEGIYIPCGGWGTVHNVARLEQDLGKPVVTWFTAMIWWFLKQTGVRAPIRGFGSLLESLSAEPSSRICPDAARGLVARERIAGRRKTPTARASHGRRHPCSRASSCRQWRCDARTRFDQTGGAQHLRQRAPINGAQGFVRAA